VHRFLLMAAVFGFATGPVSAQIAWDAPPLVSHVAPSGVSLFIIAPAGGDLGGMATFRHAAGPVGLGYRLGIADESGTGDLAVSAGVDVSGFLAREVEGSEIDVLWWSGGGVGIGSEALISFPLGILLGWSGRGSDAVLSPYAGGHLVLDLSSADQNNVDLGGAFDLGLDIALSSGWLVRFGASIGDRDALAFGVRIGS